MTPRPTALPSSNTRVKGDSDNFGDGAIRVLYSFPQKLGAGRVCNTAWQQVDSLAAAGANVLVCPGVLHKPVTSSVRVKPTLSLGKFRISYKLFGDLRAFALHDYLVSRRVEKLKGQIDIIHAWPSGALRTLTVAARLGIPTVLERPNAHTSFAYEAVQRECTRLGVHLPPGNEHAYNAEILRLEEEEFRRAYRLLCPSDFVVRTFLDKGFPPERLVRHIYGYDQARFYPEPGIRKRNRGLTMLFAGMCAVRKGVHYALEAWLKSPAHHDGEFLIAGDFLLAYREKLATMLSEPSVRVLGHRSDIPELMRKADVMILPSVEEGSALVCTEALGSGCVPLVSDVCTDFCRHMENALVHHVGDVAALTHHITLLNDNRALLESLRANGLRGAHEFTWEAAGTKLLDVYRQTIESFSHDTADTLVPR